MTKTELKTIPINKILANFSQPREIFDRTKIKELAESILSNDLINPITVRKWKNGKYMIVSGERRWQAHKVAGLKNISAFVKEYKDDVAWKIESLIENLQREDLTSTEREKFVYEIWKTGKFKSYAELARKLGYKDYTSIGTLIRAKEDREKLGVRTPKISTLTIETTRGLPDKERKEIFKKVERGDIIPERVKEIVPVIRKAPEEIKKSLFKDEISIQQAESLSRIHSPKAREKALLQVKQHRHVADITPKLMEKSKPEISDAIKKQFDSLQRRIFTHLNDAKTSLSKVDNNLKKANDMLQQLMSKSFEYGLPKRTLITTMQQIKSISDRLNDFAIENDRFDDLKDTFLDRVEDRLKELK